MSTRRYHRKCFMFHLDRDRSRRYMYARVVRSCQRSIRSVLTSSKRLTWPAVACVCKSMKLGIHSVWTNFTPDPQQVQAERFSFIPTSVIELWERANFVYKFVQKTNLSAQLWWQIWPKFPLNFFKQSSHKIPLYLFYTMIQKKSKMTKKSKQGGGGILPSIIQSAGQTFRCVDKAGHFVRLTTLITMNSRRVSRTI